MSEPKSPKAKAGWYEIPTDPDLEKYWNGEAWTSQVRHKQASKLSFSPSRQPHLRKWYLLAAVVLVALFGSIALVPISTFWAESSTKNDTSIKTVCEQMLTHNWYELNARAFRSGPDVSAREANAYFVEGFTSGSAKYEQEDPEFTNKLKTLASYLEELASADQFEPAATTATKADAAFQSFANYCEQYGVKQVSPVLSEATDNNSEVSKGDQARIPVGFTDNGEGIAYKLTPSSECPPSQFGCTALEIYAYRDCPRGVLVYGNLFDASGSEVARTDVHSDPLVAGQSTVAYLSTGLSSAASGTPNRFICE